MSTPDIYMIMMKEEIELWIQKNMFPWPTTKSHEYLKNLTPESLQKVYKLYILNHESTPISEDEFYLFNNYYSTPYHHTNKLDNYYSTSYHNTNKLDNHGRPATLYIKDLMEKHCLDAIEKGNNIGYSYLIKYYQRHNKPELAEKYAIMAVDHNIYEPLRHIAQSRMWRHLSIDENLQAMKYNLILLSHGCMDVIHDIVYLLSSNKEVFHDKCNITAILDLFHDLINKGNIDAMYYLGCYYLDRKDKVNMIKYLMMAHENGHLMARQRLISNYLTEKFGEYKLLTPNNVLEALLEFNDYNNFSKLFYRMLIGNCDIQNNQSVIRFYNHKPQEKNKSNTVHAKMNKCMVDDISIQYLLKQGDNLPEDCSPLLKLFYDTVKSKHDLEQENNDLKLALYYHPEGDAAQQAKDDFEALIQDKTKV